MKIVKLGMTVVLIINISLPLQVFAYSDPYSSDWLNYGEESQSLMTAGNLSAIGASASVELAAAIESGRSDEPYTTPHQPTPLNAAASAVPAGVTPQAPKTGSATAAAMTSESDTPTAPPAPAPDPITPPTIITDQLEGQAKWASFQYVIGHTSLGDPIFVTPWPNLESINSPDPVVFGDGTINNPRIEMSIMSSCIIRVRNIYHDNSSTNGISTSTDYRSQENYEWVGDSSGVFSWKPTQTIVYKTRYTNHRNNDGSIVMAVSGVMTKMSIGYGNGCSAMTQNTILNVTAGLSYDSNSRLTRAYYLENSGLGTVGYDVSATYRCQMFSGEIATVTEKIYELQGPMSSTQVTSTYTYDMGAQSFGQYYRAKAYDCAITKALSRPVFCQ